MVIEMRTYALYSGTVSRFLAAYEKHGLELQKGILGNLIGYFTTDIGPLNQIVHLWGYESLDDRQRRRAELAAHPQWQAFLTEILPILISQESKILLPTNFSPIR